MMNIKNKLTIVLLATAIIPLLIISTIFYNTEKEALSREVSQHLTSIASLQQARITSITNHNQELLSLVSSRTQLRLSLQRYLQDNNRKDQEKIVMILEDAQRSIKNFRSISIISTTGAILASTAPRPYADNIHLDKDLLITSQQTVSANHFFTTKTKQLRLLLAGPLVLDHSLLGVILIEADPANILATVSNYSGLGQSGEIILAKQDKDDTIRAIIPSRFNQEIATRLCQSHGQESCPLELAIQQKKMVVATTIDYRGQSVIAAAHYIAGPGWVVLVKINTAEANIAITHLRNLLAGALALMIITIFLTAFSLAKKMTLPLRKLTRAAQDIATGEFVHCAIDRSPDEIGVLAHTFNEMSANLQAAHQGLEEKIQQLNSEIQERKIAEETLLDSEKRYREIYNAPSDAIFIHDAASGDIIDVNRAALEMYGYSRAEILQTDLKALSSGIAPYDMEQAITKIKMAITKGAQLIEWQARKKDGTTFWVEVALRHVEFTGQQYVIAVVRDIHERKEATAAIAAEQERLAVTLRSIGDGVITTDINGNIVILNKIAEQLTGWSQKEAVGKPFTEVFQLLNAETDQPAHNPVAKILAHGTITTLPNPSTLICKDGSRRCIADSGAPIKDQQDEIIGVVLVFRDVTEKNRQEEELTKARKLESVGLLAGGIAHDFNNILAAILGNINLALLYTKTEDKSYILLKEAEKASIRAKNLTLQLLTFAKGGDPIKELAQVSEVIQDSANFALRGSNVRCNFLCAGDLWPVQIDQGQISQVIQNIIINSKEAMPKGGTITVNCDNIDQDQSKELGLVPHDYIKINITDNGRGIAPTLLTKIFDPYFSTKEQGNGLGLAVSHAIISKHDGYLQANSEPDNGATFTIYLPAQQAAELAKVSALQPEEEPASHQGRIMIMDDEEMVRTVTKRMLSHFGYEVILAADGQEAIRLYQEALEKGQGIDLIIMDLTIPGGMGGKEAVAKILHIDPAAKVIVASGYSNDPVMANYQEYGFLAAIIKPFQLREIQGLVQQILAVEDAKNS